MLWDLARKKEQINILWWRRPRNISYVNVVNIVIWKLVETISNSKYFIWYLDKIIRPLTLILPKMSRYVKKLKAKHRDEDKNSKLMYFRIDDEKP